MLHLIKMAVGVESVDHLAQVQHERWGGALPYRHFTRHRPKRAEEIAGHGSLFWVIKGLIRIRQPILGFDSGPDMDGRVRCAILLDSAHQRVFPQSMRPFQGWRYLAAAVAPADLTGLEGPENAALSPEMLAELRSLGLI